MTDYTKNTNFTAKDSLPSGNPAKVIKGSEFDSEFDEIATSIASKADSASGTLTSPDIDKIVDGNGNEVVIFGETASAVNEVTITNAATGTNPDISASGEAGVELSIEGELYPKMIGETTVSGAAAASMEVTGLDSTYLNGYTVEIYGISAAVGSYSIEFNGDTTTTNYNTKKVDVNPTTITTAGVANNNTITASITADQFITLRISQNSTTGEVIAKFDTFGGSSSIGAYGALTYTVTDNITSIKVLHSATGLGIGSWIRVTRNH